MNPLQNQISDVNIADSLVLPAPEFLARRLCRPASTADFVRQSRRSIRSSIFGEDTRHLVVVGPCSIHDPVAGLDYARRLKALADELDDRLQIVMRVYFEKPRTTVGWKGLIMDPHLDGSGDIAEGLQMARQFLLDVLELGLPTSTEFLDPITPQYIADLVCWAAIGARTTESQTHRQLASGLSMPVGFKNGTGGNIQLAINAIKAARAPQKFLGVSHQGLACAMTTLGNEACHLILRGGNDGPNYSAADVAGAVELLNKNALPAKIMVDCSHANSDKDASKQPEVMHAVLDQITAQPVGQSPIIGTMIESFIESGNQSVDQGKDKLVYGQSITDECIDWPTTEALLRQTHARLG